ncbi:hypothetical protein GCM10023212_13390 [Luteolibacter yonseiensis]
MFAGVATPSDFETMLFFKDYNLITPRLFKIVTAIIPVLFLCNCMLPVVDSLADFELLLLASALKVSVVDLFPFKDRLAFSAKR